MKTFYDFCVRGRVPAETIAIATYNSIQLLLSETEVV